MASALEHHRETIRSLRDLSFNIEPVVLRDQGFGAAVHELANQLGLEHRVQIEVDVGPGGDPRREGAGRALPDRSRVAEPGGAARPAVEDLGHDPGTAGRGDRDGRRGQRHRRAAHGALDAIGERASTLNGRFSVEQGADGGTAIHVVLPPYAGDPSTD